MSQDRSLILALSTERDETEETDFHEITDEFALKKARNVLFTWHVVRARKGWLYWCFDGIVSFERKLYMYCINKLVYQPN